MVGAPLNREKTSGKEAGTAKADREESGKEGLGTEESCHPERCQEGGKEESEEVRRDHVSAYIC